MRNAITAVVCCALVASIFAAGFCVCCLEPTTWLLSRMFSGQDNPNTPFNHEELVDAALATRDYTVGSHNKTELYESIYEINVSEQERHGSKTDGLDLTAWNKAGIAAQRDAQKFGYDTTLADDGSVMPSVSSMEEIFNETPDDYVLDSNAINHLDDVNTVIRIASVELVLIFLIALAGLIYLGIRVGKKRIGGVLMGSGISVVILFALLAAAAIADFSQFFSALHSIFFSQDSWVFSNESLLITMYPTSFWIGMGIIWVFVAVVLSLVIIMIGAKLRKN